ncbi:ABC transporter ATP-binding protein [Bacillus coahuilensis p1.1.43]|uniref:ABC transporter ATP-binding protein n=1 Tax=Bacillus coahuilensis p1.1.43 TaxID=1150625 RepID=A0A147K3W0_9BACI|nr:ABC transporter ATP-binding protein [Bacillus coahuilensis]KUP03982.1 ABC transporter ATP-binding protein [Bacillus coahuilensis p1.1.43]
MLTINSVSKSFGDQEVLNDISITLKKREIFALLGPSGSGKTTLIKMMIGLELPSAGTVLFQEEPLKSRTLYKNIGYMAQGDALYNELTAKENLHFFADLYSLSKEVRKVRIQSLMGMVDLTEHLNKPVHQYSGGVRRRLSLVIAMLHDPDILILDEPTVGIDPVLRKNIWEAFQQLKLDGKTLFVTTHVMDEAERCDRLGLIRGGKLIACDAPQFIKQSYDVSSIEDVFLSMEGM